MESVAPELLEWAVQGQALEGQAVSGDLHLVAPFAGGVLVAVVDGLGHGAEAAISARAAVGALTEAPSEPVGALANRCHRALRRLRGAVLSLASFDASSATMSWIGIGNVEGVLLRRPGAIDDKRERLLVWGGVVGHTMPSARAATLSVAPGDVLAFATDGIASSFADDLHAGEDVDQAAARVLAKHSTTKDDALVLVARYRGAAP